jgi:hypothetical protein
VLVDAAIYMEATSCHEKNNFSSLVESSQNCDEGYTQKDCCKDVSSLLKIETEQQAELTDVQLPKIEINSDFQIFSEQYSILIEAHNQRRLKYASPLLVYDLFIDLQSFLC